MKGITGIVKKKGLVKLRMSIPHLGLNGIYRHLSNLSRYKYRYEAMKMIEDEDICV